MIRREDADLYIERKRNRGGGAAKKEEEKEGRGCGLIFAKELKKGEEEGRVGEEEESGRKRRAGRRGKGRKRVEDVQNHPRKEDREEGERGEGGGMKREWGERVKREKETSPSRPTMRPNGIEKA